MIQFKRKKKELLRPRTLEYSSFMFIKMFLYNMFIQHVRRVC